MGWVERGKESHLIEIGDDVRITSDVQFVTHDGGVHVLRRDWCGHPGNPKINDIENIKIGNNFFIGMQALIMPGVTMGDNFVIGARSVVTKDIPSNTVVCGMPARPIRTLEEYAKKPKERP